VAEKSVLAGKRAAMVVFSPFPADPRPRRAAEALLQEGMSVDLICEGDGRSPRRETVDRLEITRIPIRRSRGGVLSYIYQYSVFILLSTAILARRLLSRRYDLVYVHNMPDILVVSALLPKLFGAKVILDQHDPMPELMMAIFNLTETSLGVRMIRRLEKWSIACADLVIAVNLASKRIFAARSCSANKIGLVMNSPDGAIFPFRAALSYPVRAPSKRFVIMYHGSLVERNGVDLAVRALAELRETIPAAELRIYGHPTPYLSKVMENVRRLGLDGQVRYLGPKRLEELANEIEKCDVGVIPSHRNAFTNINTPTRIFEYLALGKAVIAPSTRGIQDYFEPDSLFFFESGSAQDLAQKIAYVYSQPGLATETAERGQQVYLAHTWQQERTVLIGLVGSVLNGGRQWSTQ
jgi:glycosyltransferase involved in cell wall biosynthesis